MTTAYTRDRGYTRARRMGRDEEEILATHRQELSDLCEDPECDFGDLIAAAINAAAPAQVEEIHQALREMGEDRRGPRAWAKDRAEVRRLSRNTRERRARDRRIGKDFGVENLTGGPSERSIEEFGSEEERRAEEAGPPPEPDGYRCSNSL